MLVAHVVGARPNFMKMAPLLAALERDSGGYEHVLVHTGQHYDEHLNDAIFRDLGMRAPDHHLGAGSGTHAEQTARIMIAFEALVAKLRPSLTVVAGDVNSTVACSLVSAKADVPIAHVEAGLRSGDRSMPEEVNRLVTDRLSDLHLTPSPDADENLLREGASKESIVRVGNLMVDSLRSNLERARARDTMKRIGVEPRKFVLLTLHRPSNVDDSASLGRVLSAVRTIAKRLPVVFPVHPRTRPKLEAHAAALENVRLTDPLGYLDFLQLEDAAALVLTDSGGVQEETTALGVHCVTLRENTERPITVTEGTNVLAGTDPDRIVHCALEVLDGRARKGRVPDLWDGHAGERAAAAIRTFLSHRDAGKP